MHGSILWFSSITGSDPEIKFFQEINFRVCVCVCVLGQVWGENTWLWGLEKKPGNPDAKYNFSCGQSSPSLSPHLSPASGDAGHLTHASAGAQHITPSTLFSHCSFIHSHFPRNCYHLLPPITSCFVLLVLISFHFINCLPPSQWLFKQERRYTLTRNHPHLPWSPLDSLYVAVSNSANNIHFRTSCFQQRNLVLILSWVAVLLQQNSTIMCLLGWQLSSLSR